MSGSQGIPPPPPGFTLVDAAPAMPPPPPGFTLVDPATPEPPRSLGRRALDAGIGAAQALRGFNRAAMNGLLLGFLDEAQAAADAALGGDYRESLARERRATADYAARNPVASAVAGVIGGAMAPIPGFGLASTLPRAAARAGVTGALAGGIAGAGDAEGGAAEIAGGAARGAALGGAFGAALPPLVQGGAALGRRAGEAVGVLSPDTTARRLILRDMARSDVDPRDVAARAALGGKPEMLADLAGENVLQSAQVVARSPGAGRQIAADNLGGRVGAAQADRLAEDVRRFVSGDDFRQSMDDLLARQQRAAQPAYDRAMTESGPVAVGPILADLDRRIGEAKGGIRTVLERARGLLLDPEGAPDARIGALHQAKLAIDDMLSGGAESPIGRVARRELAQVQRQLVDAMDAASTVEGTSLYRQARQAYAGPAGVMDAMEVGRGLLSGNAAAFDRTAADIARMSAAEREGFRVGVARGLMDRIDNTVDGAEQTRLNQVFGSRGVRERLRAAFDNDADYQAFASSLEREARMARTNRTIAPNGGSPTMPMQERAADLRSPPGGPVAGALVTPLEAPREGMLDAWARSGNLTPSPGVLLRNMRDAARESAYRRNTEAMAPMLFTTDPAERQRYAQALVEQALRDRGQAQGLLPLLQGTIRGGAASAGLLAN